jgi:hypothetical protein
MVALVKLGSKGSEAKEILASQLKGKYKKEVV